ncbi:MAG: hypothetical protein ABIH50_06465 [bacterium]
MAIASNKVQELCNYGRARRAIGNLHRIRPTFPDKASLKHLPVGLYYHVLDSLILYLEQKLTIPTAGPQLAMAGNRPPIQTQDNYLEGPMMMVGVGKENKTFSLEEVATKFIAHVKSSVLSKKKRNKDQPPVITRQIISQNEMDKHFNSFRYRNNYEKEVLFNYLVGNHYLLVDFDRKQDDVAGGTVQFEYIIEKQQDQIKRMSKTYESRLDSENIRNIHSAVRIMIEELEKLWEGVSVYLFDGKELKITGRNRGQLKVSTYQYWSTPQGIAKKVLDEYLNNGTTGLRIDLQAELLLLEDKERAKESCVSLKSIDGDYTIFLLDSGNPGSMLVKLLIKPEMKDKKDGWALTDVLGIVYLDNRLLKSDVIGKAIAAIYPAIRYKPPTSLAEHVNAVVAQLNELILWPTAKVIGQIIGAGSIRAILSAESPINTTDGVGKSGSTSSPKLAPITEEPKSAEGSLALVPASSDTRMTTRMDQYSDSSYVDGFLGYQIEVNHDPALNFGENEEIRARVVSDAQALTASAIGQTPTAQEMTDHLIKVSVSETVRDMDGKVVAFGTSRYFDGYTNNKGEREKLTLLWGTMVHPDHRRKGWLIKLNYDLIRAAKSAVAFSLKGIKFFKRPFVAAPMVVRTQNEAVWTACNRHFAGVTPIGRKPKDRQQQMIQYAAKKQGWELDENNVQRGAYSSKRVDNEKDLIPGLGPNDAFVFAGDFTFWRALLTKVIVDIVYPIRFIFRKKRKNKQ